MEVSVTYRITADLDTVYQSIVDKNKLNKYFVSYASDDLDKATTITWKWEDYNAECDIYDVMVQDKKQISFTWTANGEARNVNIQLEELSAKSTEIHITEGSFEKDEDQIQKMLQQNQGWTDFICSLKAYLYAGINLRK